MVPGFRPGHFAAGEMEFHPLQNSLTESAISRRRLLIAWLPMMIWLVVIAFESTSMFTSEHTMNWIGRLLGLFFHHLGAAKLAYLNHIMRKVGHFTGYGILSWFAFRGWMETIAYRREQSLLQAGRTIRPQRQWQLSAAVLAVFCTAVVAAMDEYHQTFLPGRTGVVRDVVLDTMGAIFIQIVLLLYWTSRKKPHDPTALRPALEWVPTRK